MGTASGSNGKQRDWKRRESLGSALTQVALVALLLGGAVTFVVHRGQVRQETETRLKAAQSLAQRGNPADLAKALQELEGLFAVDADVYGAHVLAADIHAVLWLDHHQPSSEALAREHLARAESLESKDSERYGARVVRAWVTLSEGKASEAAETLKGLRERGASNSKLWLAQARADQALGNLQGARQAYARATDGAWKDPRFATAYGEALLEEGLFVQAGEALGRATAANPDHLQARLTGALAHLYLRQKLNEVERTLQDIQAREAELSPALKARALATRAELALSRGNPDAALRDADAALALHPGEPYALFGRAKALAAKKDPSARAAFEAAVAKRKTAPLFYIEGAKTLQQAADTSGALALLDAYEATFRGVQVSAAEGKTVSALERDDRYWLARGNVLEAANRPDEALAAYEHALAVKGPQQARAQYAKGALLLARKDYAGAKEVLAGVTPDNGTSSVPEAYTAMAELLFAQGDYATGCQHHYFALSRARGRGVPTEQLQAQAAEISKQLTDAGQAKMAQAWKAEAEALLK
ncbi:tetratricopeptide repeat protein [Stigmatella aurantiaca]|uniref:Putative cellulose biosynthesis protein n=1 Tax=Stigmatella aurantiaca (strain DW4/3-1) TaxID=378806 RepID=Q08P18_STIAD|nr:tetratricopeptide repeat protein [Stigmatella aurantiaca]ADO71039.1 Tetratricopeptide repeat protein [Stigmatella aurantiaca DW4/3-1]EAU62229.1 putative cellulose biosynthesis protein [Stigmatella aurantiaca DW4/3-1]